MAHVARLYRAGRIEPGPLTLDAAQSRRLSAVLRLRAGEEFRLFSGDGREWSAVVAETGSGGTNVRVDSLVRQEPAAALTLEVWCALVRANRFDLAVEKCTEVGADIIRPLITDHAARGDQPSAQRMERWNRLAIEASEQCGRLHVPVIAEPLTFRDALSRAHHPVVFGDLGGTPWSAVAALLPDAGRLALAIGPEGGWSDAERAAARATGALFARLGETVMRTETAAIALTALVRARA